MEIKGKVHCLFEQSGTFKKQFIQLGISSEDYDIQDGFGETDNVVDLFQAIEDAYNGLPSLFDNIDSNDLIMAFFPCVYFSAAALPQLSWGERNYRNLTDKEKSDAIIERINNRERYYILAIKMLTVAKMRGLRLIMENPWGNTYLKTFIQAPALIDNNRQLRGDYFKKPTAYWYINCQPTIGYSLQVPKEIKTIESCRKAKQAGMCSEERSLISPDYARNFICDFILGREQLYTMRSLFNEIDISE